MTESIRRGRTAIVVAGVAMVGMLVAGCGNDSPDDTAGSTPGPAPAAANSPSPSGMGDMGNMMNDPDATPASHLPSATEATFTLLDTAPSGSEEVAGTAWIARGGDPGTTLTVELTGLQPGAEYVGHLHAQPCAQDDGGPHFKFDPDGADTPPNELHIGFTADGAGAGFATVTNQQAADGAASVVIHPAAATDNRLVCADF